MVTVTPRRANKSDEECRRCPVRRGGRSPSYPDVCHLIGGYRNRRLLGCRDAYQTIYETFDKFPAASLILIGKNNIKKTPPDRSSWSIVAWKRSLDSWFVIEEQELLLPLGLLLEDRRVQSRSNSLVSELDRVSSWECWSFACSVRSKLALHEWLRGVAFWCRLWAKAHSATAPNNYTSTWAARKAKLEIGLTLY